MARKVSRNRSQTLSLRISPKVRFGLECLSNDNKTSMTQTIERALVQSMSSSTIECPTSLSSKYSVDGKVRVSDVLALAWSEDDVVRLLRTGILAPRYLTEAEIVLYAVFAGIYKQDFTGVLTSYRGTFDPFEAEHESMSESYCDNGPRFDLLKCRKDFESLKERFEFAFLDDEALRAYMAAG